jgi:hypothetical protein
VNPALVILALSLASWVAIALVVSVVLTRCAGG